LWFTISRKNYISEFILFSLVIIIREFPEIELEPISFSNIISFKSNLDTIY
jgi:hypothetical protein